MEIYHQLKIYEISTHAPAGGATLRGLIILGAIYDFYSRPCGRGDEAARRRINERIEFLLTPLREGRRGTITGIPTGGTISTHAPAGGATRRGLADRP